MSSGSLTTIGLTGGIASGKSTARELLAQMGAVAIDADKLGHRCYEPGTKCFEEVVALFGKEIVAADGQIDRKKLGPIVFGSEEKMKQLSATTWPHIKRMITDALDEHRKASTSLVVVEAAVMMEAKWEDAFDEVWVSYVAPELAKQRLMVRNSLTADEAEKRMSKQLSNEERLAKATVKLENSGSKDDLEKAVRAEYAKLRKRVEKAGKPMPERRSRPRFGKVSAVKPEMRGVNLLLKVVSKEASEGTNWKVLAGDASGVLALRLSSEEHLKACEAGADIRVQNARVVMVQGFIHVVVDKWAVLKAADTPLDLQVNESNNISALEYEVHE